MFKLFKRKNEMKELKGRVAVIEAQVIILDSQQDKASYGNFNKEAVIPLKNAEFINKISNELSKAIKEINEMNEIKSNEATAKLFLQIDKTEIGKIVIDNINKVQRQGGTKLLRV